MAQFDPPLLTEGPLSGRILVVTHGKVEPHPTIDGETMITASRKYDVTDQFDALIAKRTHIQIVEYRKGFTAGVKSMLDALEGRNPEHAYIGPLSDSVRDWIREVRDNLAALEETDV